MPIKKLLILAAATSAPLYAAAAAPSYVAAFAEPAKVSQLVSSERLWSCDGATCRAGGSATSPAKHICVRLAKEVGAVASFSALGRDFTADELAACNQRAGRDGSGAAAK